MAKKSLADELLELNQAKTDFDIENDENIVSDSEGSESSDDETKTEHYIEVSKSKLRKNIPKNVYGGKVSSRNEIFGDDNEEEVNDEDEEEEEEEEKVEEEDYENENEEEDEEEEEEEEGSSDSASALSDKDSDSDLESEQHSDVDEHKRDQLKSFISQERKTIGKRIAQSNINDALKGYSVLNQNKIFDQIIDSRIKLQKALTKSNSLPKDPETAKEFITSETDSIIDQVEDKCYSLLETIIKLRNKFNKKDNLQEFPVPKKRKLDNHYGVAFQLDDTLSEFRGIVLNKWSRKVQSSSGSNALNAGKFKVINQSAEQQVVNNLNDMERLKRKTYLNRSAIEPLGYKEDNTDDIEEEEENPDVPKLVIKKDKNEIKQIFDDEDFYRLLLNDLIDKKITSSNPINGVTLSLRQTQKAQKANKNIDTRASKGRKLKFNIQEPIAHFETSINTQWDDNQIDEFFASLLGQKINLNEIDEDINEQDEQDELIENDTIKLFS